MLSTVLQNYKRQKSPVILMQIPHKKTESFIESLSLIKAIVCASLTHTFYLGHHRILRYGGIWRLLSSTKFFIFDHLIRFFRSFQRLPASEMGPGWIQR